jgi:hypothetical protein
MIAFAKPEQIELNELFDDVWEPSEQELKAVFDSFRTSAVYAEFIAGCEAEDELETTSR